MRDHAPFGEARAAPWLGQAAEFSRRTNLLAKPQLDTAKGGHR